MELGDDKQGVMYNARDNECLEDLLRNTLKNHYIATVVLTRRVYYQCCAKRMIIVFGDINARIGTQGILYVQIRTRVYKK